MWRRIQDPKRSRLARKHPCRAEHQHVGADSVGRCRRRPRAIQDGVHHALIHHELHAKYEGRYEDDLNENIAVTENQPNILAHQAMQKIALRRGSGSAATP